MNKVEEFANCVRRLLKPIPMELRLAAKEDIPDLVRLRIELLKIGEPVVNALKEGLLALSLANYFVRHLEAGDLICWVVSAGGKIVGGGCISFYGYPPGFDGMEEEMASLINLYTLPGYSDAELERQLFGKLLEEAERRNVPVVTVQDTEVVKGGNAGFEVNLLTNKRFATLVSNS